MLEFDQDIHCPYCLQSFSVRIDATGGHRQHFILDCEVCCRPIQIEAAIEQDGYIDLIAKREGEG